ncbi:hypothetical protein [Tuberibacillus sp. Marseille-P3662]|uniref:hypothetical protein n=1 Tax=Tuberibacillus sp. Marseille-P3662 TaxID=1965358 RepID=UPI000A1C8058|nr:hypothetical protein [Tuberibacillus sp. Marseille-P3662]
MITTGIIMIAMSSVLGFLVIPALTLSVIMTVIMFIFSISAGIIGSILVFAGVLRDRLKEKEEDDQNDYSQY